MTNAEMAMKDAAVVVIGLVIEDFVIRSGFGFGHSSFRPQQGKLFFIIF